MSPRLILFDIDGTLVDTAGAGRRGLVETFRVLFGVDGDVEASRKVRFEGKTDPIIVTDLAHAFGVDVLALAGCKTEFEETYLRIVRGILATPDSRRRVLPGIARLLDDLAARPDVHLGLLTGNIEAGGRAKLAAFDLNRFFPTGGFASDHEDRAVIARIAREKAEQLAGVRFETSDTVVVGDTEHDIQCARANDFHAVAVSSGWVPREKLVAARPDALFDDFLDLDAVLAALGIPPH